MKRSVLALSLITLFGCGGSDDDLATTVATLRPVRGAWTVDDVATPVIARLVSGAHVAAPGSSLARLEFDGGARALLGAESRATVLDEAALQLEAGRVFAEARRAESFLRVSTPHVELRLRDAGVSVTVSSGEVRAYVVRGELSWTRGSERGVVGPGRELVVDAQSLRVEPATLWDDWTGGLAEPGPEGGSAAAGVGVLEARVPDEVGRARWPLVARRLDVRVQIRGDLAITEVDQLFFNPASESLEGLYRIRVPQGAVLQRFAVDRDGELVDGYVRERGQALQAYTEQVYRGSTDDPALLEWDGPAAYRARIYPIRAGETRRIVVRYGEWLKHDGSRRRYRYPMGGGQRAPRIQELSLFVDLEEAGSASVRAGLGARAGDGFVRLRRSDFVPHADFWLDLDDVGGETSGSQRVWRAAHLPPERASAMRPGTHEADERDYWLLPLVLPERLAESDVDTGVDLVIVADLSAGTDRTRAKKARRPLPRPRLVRASLSAVPDPGGAAPRRPERAPSPGAGRGGRGPDRRGAATRGAPRPDDRARGWRGHRSHRPALVIGPLRAAAGGGHG